METTKHEVLCPVCDVGRLAPFHSRETYSYKGKQFFIENLEFSRCENCGAELVMPDQSRRNEALVREEHRRIDGLLTGSEIRRIRDRFSLSQAEAAEIFGGGANAFSKYERGEVAQSVAMDRLLRLVDEVPSNLYRLMHIAGIELASERTLLVICDYGSPCSIESHSADATLSLIEKESRGGRSSNNSIGNWNQATGMNTH